jgi:hypothetical protein
MELKELIARFTSELGVEFYTNKAAVDEYLGYISQCFNNEEFSWDKTIQQIGKKHDEIVKKHNIIHPTTTERITDISDSPVAVDPNDVYAENNLHFGEQLTIRDEEGRERTFDLDKINLLDDENEISEYPIAQVSQAEFDNGEIVCPLTNSSDIYRISEGLYASFDTDQPFLIQIVDK